MCSVIPPKRKEKIIQCKKYINDSKKELENYMRIGGIVQVNYKVIPSPQLIMIDQPFEPQKNVNFRNEKKNQQNGPKILKEKV